MNIKLTEKQIATVNKLREPIQVIQSNINIYISGLLSEKETPENKPFTIDYEKMEISFKEEHPSNIDAELTTEPND